MECVLWVLWVLLLASPISSTSNSKSPTTFEFPSFEKAVQEFKSTTRNRPQKDVHRQLKLSDKLETRFKGPLLADLETRIRKRPVVTRRRRIQNPEFKKEFLDRRKALISERFKFRKRQPSQNQKINEETVSVQETKGDSIRVSPTIETIKENKSTGQLTAEFATKLKSQGTTARRVAVRRRKIPNRPTRQHKLSTAKQRKRIVVRRRRPKPVTTTAIPDYLDYINDYFDEIPEKNSHVNIPNNQKVTSDFQPKPVPQTKLNPIPVSNNFHDIPEVNNGKKLTPIPVGQILHSKSDFKSENQLGAGRSITSKLQPVPVETSSDEFSSLFDSHQQVFQNAFERPQPKVPVQQLPEYEYDYLQESEPESIDYSHQSNDGSHDKQTRQDGFRYGYKVDDSEDTGNFHTRTEERDGKTVSGTYEVALPDGRIQVVKYIADGDGFRADVSYIENSNAPKTTQPPSPVERRRRPNTIVQNQNTFQPTSAPAIQLKPKPFSQTQSSKPVGREKRPNTIVRNENKPLPTPVPAFQLTPKPLSQSHSRQTVDPKNFRDSSPIFHEPLLNIEHENDNSFHNLRPEDRRQTTAQQAVFRNRNVRPNDDSTGSPLFREALVEPFLTTTHPPTEEETQSKAEGKQHRFSEPSAQTFSGNITPNPKPIAPIHHREVARIPPNPFTRQTPKSDHRPVQPSPQKLLPTGHIRNPFELNFNGNPFSTSSRTERPGRNRNNNMINEHIKTNISRNKIRPISSFKSHITEVTSHIPQKHFEEDNTQQISNVRKELLSKLNRVPTGERNSQSSQLSGNTEVSSQHQFRKPQNSRNRHRQTNRQRNRNIKFTSPDEAPSKSANPFRLNVQKEKTKAFVPPSPVSSRSRPNTQQHRNFQSQRHQNLPPISRQNIGLINFNAVTGNFELISTTPRPSISHNNFFIPNSPPPPPLPPPRQNFFFIPTSTPPPFQPVTPIPQIRDPRPIIFQYPSSDGSQTPPLIFDPNQPVFLSSLGGIHPIPLLLPLDQGVRGAVNRTRRRNQPGDDGLQLSESEIFIHRQDIYPEPNTRKSN